MILKNVFIFYLFLFIPLIILVLLAAQGLINSLTFFICLLIYALVYNPAICGMRLISMDKIKQSDFFKNFIPFWSKKYFKSLFWG